LLKVQHCEDLHRWNSLAVRTFGSIEVRSLHRGFQGGMSVSDWPSLRLIEVHSTPACVTGGAPLQRGWFVLFNRAGRCRLRQGGCQTAIDAHEMTLLRADEPYEIGFAEANRMQIAALPLLGLPEGLQQGVMRHYGADEAAVVGALLGRLQALGAGDRSPERVALQRLLVDLLLLATPDADRDAARQPARREQARLDRLKALVAQRLDDPELGAGVLADGLGVSVRSVQKLLAGQGTTLGAYLVEQRLLRAAELLRSGRSRIADIALQVGFGDISYFCRAFRQRFGCTASQWREGG
jgi:AraC-like DNA-binding protein